MRLAVLVLMLTSTACYAKEPTFEDFAVKEVYSGYPARAVLTDPRAKEYRTRLIAASKLEPNFAGHYHLVTWGCGTSCSAGAIVEAATGRVMMLPSVSGYQGVMKDDFEAIDGQLHSRLLVMHGQINEEGINGDHFFTIEDGQLRHLADKEIKPIEDAPAENKGATAAQLAYCARIVKQDERLMCFDVLSGHAE